MLLQHKSQSPATAHRLTYYRSFLSLMRRNAKLLHGLEKAIRQERRFFLRYPIIGYDEAHELYARPAIDQVERVVIISNRNQI
ncbi:hypothetical protein ACFLVW_07250 [Chloroflexota bacterium]